MSFVVIQYCYTHLFLLVENFATVTPNWAVVYMLPVLPLYAQPSVVTGFDYIVFPLQQVGGNASLIWST